MLYEVILDEALDLDVALVAGRIERDEARKQLFGAVGGAVHEWLALVARARIGLVGPGL